MPTIATIQAQPSTELTSIEREIVRHVIGINGRASSAVYTDSEERFEVLTADQNRLVRALLIDYDDIDNTTTAISGGSDGLDVSFSRNRVLIASQIRRIMYPTDLNDPLFDDGSSLIGSLQFIPVSYNNGSVEYD